MTGLPLAITRVDIGDYVETLMYVYLVLIFIRIIVSWFRSIPYHPVLSAFLTFVLLIVGGIVADIIRG